MHYEIETEFFDYISAGKEFIKVGNPYSSQIFRVSKNNPDLNNIILHLISAWKEERVVSIHYINETNEIVSVKPPE